MDCLALGPKFRLIESVHAGCWPLRFMLKKTPVLKLCALFTIVKLSVHANWRASLSQLLAKPGKLQPPMPQLNRG